MHKYYRQHPEMCEFSWTSAIQNNNWSKRYDHNGKQPTREQNRMKRKLAIAAWIFTKEEHQI